MIFNQDPIQSLEKNNEKADELVEKTDTATNKISQKEESKIKIDVEERLLNTESKKEVEDKPWRKIVVTISFVTVIAAIIYFVTNWRHKDCMIWVDDHYEKIACGKTNVPEIALNQNLLENFKKVQLDTAMRFFKDGEALFWYQKKDGNVEFFNMKGVHPIYKTQLKPITQTIVRKYIYKEE